ncbi:MAG TPA: hypothetical protein VM578_12845 [Candidatus Saccharimonadales bacterium]|nr:hypothetical protein [Candidatus Saccharimonadales bacterium]
MKHIKFVALLVVVTATFAVAQNTRQTTDTPPEPAVQKNDAAKEGAGKTTETAGDTAQKAGAGKDAPPRTEIPETGAPTPMEPVGAGEPHTEMLDTANGPSSRDPLLEPKPLPRADLSLIGGIARKVDVVHNRLTVEPFGGGNKYVIYYDERTRILSGGRETTVLAVRPGSRVYVDTQALGAQVFARTIQVRGSSGPAQASGQVIENLGGQVRMQDRLSGETIRFVVSDKTLVESRDGKALASDLHAGSLIDVTFIPGAKRSEAQSILIHASPGGTYVFAGVLTHVNLRDGVLALDNQVDGNNYELYFDPVTEKSASRLVEGTPVSVTASFDGKRYRASSIKITEASASLESSDR